MRRAGHNASAPSCPFSNPTFKQSSASPVDRSRTASSRDRAKVLSDSASESFFSAWTRSDSARRNSSSAFFSLSLASGNSASASPSLRKSSSSPPLSLCSSFSLAEISIRILSKVSLRWRVVNSSAWARARAPSPPRWAASRLARMSSISATASSLWRRATDTLPCASWQTCSAC